MREILSEVPHCDRVADVGCDHGYLGCALLEAKQCRKVLFSDVSEESLEKARRAVARLGLSDRAEFFLADGLSHLQTPADAAIVAGLGGREIAAIVTALPHAAEVLILQPMKNGAELRRALAENGFLISVDRKIEDGGRFYDLLVARFAPGADCGLSQAEIKYGKTNLTSKTPAFCGWVKKMRGVFGKVLENPDLSEEDRKQALVEWEELGELERRQEEA